jgi:hypothetical protein
LGPQPNPSILPIWLIGEEGVFGLKIAMERRKRFSFIFVFLGLYGQKYIGAHNSLFLLPLFSFFS